MTMQAVQQALVQGYSIKKIIDWLTKNKGQLSSAIKEAMRQGYNEDQIEEYLTRSAGMPFSAKNRALPGMTEEEKGRGIHYKGSKAQRNIGNILQTAAVAAPVAAASYALSPMLTAALGRAAPQLMQTAAQRFPALAPLFGQMGQMGQAPLQPQGTALPATQPGQAVAQPQTPALQNPVATPALPTGGGGAIAGNILNSFLSTPMGKLAQNVSSQYQDVPTVSGIIRHFFDKEVNKFERATGAKLEDILSQVLSKSEKNIPSVTAAESQELNPQSQISSAEEAEKPTAIPPSNLEEKSDIRKEATIENARHLHDLWEKSNKVHPFEKVLKTNLKLDDAQAKQLAASFEEAKSPKVEEPSKIEKNSVVSSPQGIGQVREIRNGQALIDVNGKLNKVSVEDLEPEPEEIKRAEIIIKPEEIPENLRSAALGFVSVPKSRRDIDIMYGPSGKFYRYYRKDGKPVPDDIVEKLREGQTMPISSGDTYMGAFDASIADSRGTVAYHDLKSKAQSKEAVEHGVEKKGKHMKEKDDPSKEYWYEALESPFIHGFIDEFLKILTQRSREYQKAQKAKK